MPDAVVVSWARTPIGRFLGGLAGIPAPSLAGAAIRAALERGAVPPRAVEEAIVGNVVSAGLGQAPARQAAMGAGIPDSVPSFAVNKVCGSGLQAAVLAARAIRAGDASVAVAAGMESMSRAPHLLRDLRRGRKLGPDTLEDAALLDGLLCAFENWHMGNAAEHIARRFEIPRRAQDDFALRSHRRAVAAWEAGRFAAEVVPVRRDDGGEISRDECPRPETSEAALAALPPAFEKGGTVTAGNAPPLSDGAAALVLASRERARAEGWRPRAEVVAYAAAGVAPREIFHAPVPAIERVLAIAGMRLPDVHRIELNEAFSAQALANCRALGIDPERVNPWGGSVALGHPIGASGARILATLLTGLEHEGGEVGLAALCLGGGGAVAMIVRRI